mmetsp:Transcript_51356/g.122009  ORF Transcript_51356/g.122009 Transcript_51356/m.122009 type:complete len:303 (-) Transcript_51356:496-1404(-)
MTQPVSPHEPQFSVRPVHERSQTTTDGSRPSGVHSNILASTRAELEDLIAILDNDRWICYAWWCPLPKKVKLRLDKGTSSAGVGHASYNVRQHGVKLGFGDVSSFNEVVRLGCNVVQGLPHDLPQRPLSIVAGEVTCIGVQCNREVGGRFTGVEVVWKRYPQGSDRWHCQCRLPQVSNHRLSVANTFTKHSGEVRGTKVRKRRRNLVGSHQRLKVSSIIERCCVNYLEAGARILLAERCRIEAFKLGTRRPAPLKVLVRTFSCIFPQVRCKVRLAEGSHPSLRDMREIAVGLVILRRPILPC